MVYSASLTSLMHHLAHEHLVQRNVIAVTQSKGTTIEPMQFPEVEWDVKFEIEDELDQGSSYSDS